jgi:dCTP deaminase
MILCDAEIRAALRNGQIIIDPQPPDGYITTSAIDLRLGGREFRRWKVPGGAGARFDIEPSAPGDYHDLAQRYQEDVTWESDGSILLPPGDFILAQTEERVVLRPESRVAARVEGRSRLARFGLTIHLTAPTIHAGFRGRITLEITNQGPLTLRLRPGARICQLIFEQLFGTPQGEMSGAFQDQESVMGRPQS